ncbi:hypothetical protein [Halodesulfovibrio aestuarii]|uniref:hypothetical protein n=1 Tax=Halodesulfovibrio aestuarii TaxID=126333 RepID=UPI0003A6318B|nr:hypothetical protein [Halodesulfovibrio aestuarii]
MIKSTPTQESTPAPEPTPEPAATKAEELVRHTLRIPASMERRFMKWQMDQVIAGRPKSEVSFNAFVSEAMDNALKAAGYGETL